MIFMFILLAGSSTRMGSSTLKQFINISKKEIFEYSLETFDKIEKINKIFLVAQKDNFEHINQIILNKKYNHEIEIIEGGATRQESVFNSLNIINYKTYQKALFPRKSVNFVGKFEKTILHT